jgi:hypothetical protein
MDYRLVDPPPKAGKYRQQFGLAPSAFLSRPDQKELSTTGWVIVVEGSKKAAVTCLNLQDLPQVIGVPGCNAWAGIDQLLAKSKLETVYIIMDPGAERWAMEKAKLIGKAARILRLPSKVDDAFVSYGMQENDFRNLLRQARHQ